MNVALKRKISLVLLGIIALVFWSSGTLADEGIGEEEVYPESQRGKVLEIISEEDKEIDFSEDQRMNFQLIRVLITSGKHKGEEITVENIIDDRFAYNINVSEGDHVLLHLEQNAQGDIEQGYISEIARDRFLVYLSLIFVLLLILVGGMKGLKSIITLIITGIAVLKILLPLILAGYSPVLVSVLVSIGVIAITLIIIGGIKRKTLSAIIGTSSGVIVAGILTLIIGSMAKLTGLGTEEAQMLMFIPQGIDFDFRGILFSGIILGALGAVMDVSMSIASSMHEIHMLNPNISKKDLIKAGMNVGKDIMGTMSNTLILAYTGGSLQLMLLFLAYDIPLIEIINRDMIASEVVRALAGSIGLICTIPLTALVASTIGRERNIENTEPLE